MPYFPFAEGCFQFKIDILLLLLDAALHEQAAALPALPGFQTPVPVPEVGSLRGHRGTRGVLT